MRTIGEELQETFGGKVYKIALTSGCTCPNRDGTLGVRGCIFCSGKGSGEFAEDAGISVTEQIERAKRRVAAKMPEGEGRYIAYFQSFTNTYAPVERLKVLFMEAISHPEVVILSIATRPDCLPPEVLDLLKELNHIKPVWVELGLQTIHEETAEYIRRGYSLCVFDRAVRELQERDLYTIVHVILGLPGEDRTAMLETVRYVRDCGVQGIKLQLLHVLKGTDLATEYATGKVPVMDMETYTNLVADCVELIGDRLTIHRLTGDGDRKLLIAPVWSADKKRVLNTIHAKIRERKRTGDIK